MFLQNGCIHLQDNAQAQPRRLQSEKSPPEETFKRLSGSFLLFPSCGKQSATNFIVRGSSREADTR
jgi:hypothetical protein